MQWYGGSVAEAVALSKQRNAIFVVFIEGDNDLSVEMAATIEEPEVVKRLTDPANFLAIKLQSGSPHYTHFAQIYQFVPVPSLFFIGRNGTPLEVVCAGVQAANLATRIDRILEAHHKEKPLQPSGSAQDGKQQSSELLQAETSNANSTAGNKGGVDSGKLAEKTHQEEMPESSSGPSPPKVQKTEEYDVVCEGDVCKRVPKSRPDQAGASSANVVIDNRVEVSNILSSPPTQSTPTQSSPSRSPPTQPSPTQSPPTQPSPTQSPPTQSPPTQSLPTQPSPTQPAASIDDKVEKAKELIEAKRREKAAKEKELEKQRELERRAVGQGVTELKQWQAEQALKQAQEERKREKMENNLARQRILEQIAQDRAERRARDQAPAPLPATATPAQVQNNTGLQQQLEQYRSERRAQAAPAPLPPVSHPQPTLAHTSPAPGDAPTQARIQFKLPDGSSHTAHFRPEDTLTEVHTYVSDNLQLSQNNYSLWIAFPRRELTEPTATLLSLQLTPSAALLVLPRRQNREVTQPSQISVIMTLLTQLFTQYVLAPSRWVFNWVQARLFPTTTGGTASPDEPPTDSRGPSAAPVAPSVRRRTNIHRLGEHPQDDDNNTWNGNSTQQM